ncbi:unnamed protein product [Penicillium egyptiacum]|uniref:Uncharacterized protein n=1 Tax=Penicillium egyptiacum TaxID=1303716 RepID=A0A9W4P863_9EURO|nr:unnamed protein product [Penicillium egyptiacum]
MALLQSYLGEYNNRNVNSPMTPSTEAYLPAYNGQLNLASAFVWSVTRIQVFMIEVIDNPSTYGVERKVESELKRLRTDIVDLSQKGSKYQSEASCPQAISRIVNPAGASKDESYLLLDTMTYEGLPYWCSFDLLGRFLSIISPAPQGATHHNFYLPLTLMYANWCRKIAPKAPWMYSCAWAGGKDKQSRFHLGASLGGYSLPKEQGGRWVSILQQARFDILRDERTDAVGLTIQSSTLRSSKRKPIPYGNCAETYPLVHLLRNRDPSEEVYGLAVMLRKLPEAAYNHPQALDTLVRPCSNCQDVIGIWGGKVENFITDDMPENSTTASSGVQSPISPCPDPRASGFALPTRIKWPSPEDDTAEPAAKRVKGPAPEISRKPSHLAKRKDKPQ